MSINKKSLVGGLLTVPTLTAGVSHISNTPVSNIVEFVTGQVDNVLNLAPIVANSFGVSEAIGSSLVPGLSGISTALLSNQLMKDLGVKNKYMKYGINAIAGLGGLIGGTVAAPYLVGGALSYWVGKHGYEIGKEILKAGYSFPAGTLKSMILSPIKGVKATKNSFGRGNFKLDPNIK